ncbi:sensor histidine kinase [Flavihumibacter profundi]|jgi:signal transduction histidine kinase|uniref:sensor histidine kinase n=1 Tax=Flavihumibacter profundi TaxID=2716883 RepID=UPI001CC526FE|nr:HAMP domain-containing sensor histidine kinase [Flavihumibacter profundi]MBZ5857689.1 HAMP domain-containing histidine kinase [Flavihumibacter profundi]
MSKTLEQKNTRYLLLWLPVVLLLGSVLFFVMLNMHANHTQEKLLELKQLNVFNAFTAQPASMATHIRGEYSLDEGTVLPKELLDKSRDTSMTYTDKGGKINFRELTRQYVLNGKTYQLTTYVSSNEFSHLTIKVFATEALVFVFLLLAIVVINRKSSRLLWRPFYSTLKKAGEYDVVRNQSIQLEQQTGIAEFNQLNSELTYLVEKVNKAYSNQKNFVENASHEIQTPLAIIRSKLDLLINESGLTEKSAALLGEITEASERLSQMNKSLLLLAKIDNNQFPEKHKINVSELLENILNNYQEHYEAFPSLTRSILPGVYIMANPALAEILIGNLVKNAVVHNLPGGYIKVHLDQTLLSIENTGKEIAERPEQLFERFRKGNADSKTTGLGLALVKQVTQLYEMGLLYEYENGIHRVTVAFNLR